MMVRLIKVFVVLASSKSLKGRSGDFGSQYVKGRIRARSV